jgi:hypothetical protein
MGKQCKRVFRHCDLGRAKSLLTRGAGHILLCWTLPHRVGLGFKWSLHFFLEADGTRSTQGAGRPGTKRGGGSQNRLTMQCAQWNASRAAAWQRRRVAVARHVRIDFVRNFVFSLVSVKNGNRPSAGIQCLELVDLPKGVGIVKKMTI